MIKYRIIIALLVPLAGQPAPGQKKALESVNVDDLKMHLDFLASDELEGRDTGEPGMDVAARYLHAQAAHIGLKSADPENGYFQYYSLEKKQVDWYTSNISFRAPDETIYVDDKPFYFIPGLVKDHFVAKGSFVFAGYGINDEELAYNDFEGLEIKDKIIMIMNRSPMNDSGTVSKLGGKWAGEQNLGFKLQYIVSQEPRAILLVLDPKSKMRSLEDMSPGITRYLTQSIAMKQEEQGEVEEPEETPGPKIIVIHSDLADRLLGNKGYTLAGLQEEIDRNMQPRSFDASDIEIRIELNKTRTELRVPNVFGIIPGSDPVLKDEYVLYLAHFDHVGTDTEGAVFNGADDNASGTVALLEVAQALMKEKKKPARSIGFLWVSGEEIGLYGSSYFASHPLVPADKIAAVINLDMVGRTLSDEDIARNREGMTIQAKDSVKVIGGRQSSILMGINEKVLSESGLKPNYAYNDENHPERYFYRSDHINFARMDIPVLFYSTGTHSDYHQVTDDPEKIDYEKFLRMTKFCLRVGYETANYKGEIVVDNPMSAW